MRKILFVFHRYFSLIFFVPIIILSLTGSILIYKYELDKFLMPEVVIATKQKEKISFDKLTNIIKEAYPNYEIAGWRILKDENTANQIYLIEHDKTQWNIIYINQYTGKIQDKLKPKGFYFSDLVEKLHTNLFLQKNGKTIVGIFGLIFCLLAISGIIIYKKFWKNLFTLRFDKNILVYMNDIHKFFGIVSSPILLIIGLTGTYWSLKPLFKNNVISPYTVHEKMYNKEISIDGLYKKAKKNIKGFEVYYIGYPYRENRQLMLYGETKEQNILFDQYSNVVTFDKNSAELLKSKKVEHINISDKFFKSFRKAHFGSYSETTKLIWFIMGLVPLILSITGLTLMYQKRKKRSN